MQTWAGTRDAVWIPAMTDNCVWHIQLRPAALDRGCEIRSISRMSTPVEAWHELVRTKDPKGFDSLLADDAVFHSPVVHTPQVGKAITQLYLTAALQVFVNPSFRYVREIIGTRDAALEFQVEIDGVSVNGVDLIGWNDAGKISTFKVMIRPLKAINLIHQKMAALVSGK
jgi:SnoaL-like domain